MMNARPLFDGMTRRNSTRASNPPADAPIPTTQGSESRTTERRRFDLAAFVGLARVEAMVLAQQVQSASLRQRPEQGLQSARYFFTRSWGGGSKISSTATRSPSSKSS